MQQGLPTWLKPEQWAPAALYIPGPFIQVPTEGPLGTPTLKSPPTDAWGAPKKKATGKLPVAFKQHPINVISSRS